jgi:hypothetical protein
MSPSTSRASAKYSGGVCHSFSPVPIAPKTCSAGVERSPLLLFRPRDLYFAFFSGQRGQTLPPARLRLGNAEIGELSQSSGPRLWVPSFNWFFPLGHFAKNFASAYLGAQADVGGVIDQLRVLGLSGNRLRLVADGFDLIDAMRES